MRPVSISREKVEHDGDEVPGDVGLGERGRGYGAGDADCRRAVSFVRMVSHMVGEWEIHDGSRHVQDSEHEDGTNSELAGCCELEFPE